ncbi:hypothetical protein [Kitasatospora sp. NPDC057223]
MTAAAVDGPPGPDEARTELELSTRLCRNSREHAVLLRKAAALG